MPLAKTGVLGRSFVMLFRLRTFSIFFALVVLCSGICRAQSQAAGSGRSYDAKGVVRELKADGRTVVIQHEAVADYMPAMTMPFEVRDTNELRACNRGTR